jgi:hypothetical protein
MLCWSQDFFKFATCGLILCVIQGDDKDWEMESSRMGDYYSNSYLTIAASSSSDDSSRCFPTVDYKSNLHGSSDAEAMGEPYVGVTPFMEESPGHSEPCYYAAAGFAFVDYKHDTQSSRIFVTQEWMPPSGKDEPLVYQIGKFGSHFDPIQEELLSTRGWTLQERVLSPRTIHYATGQMYWECQEYLLAEDGAYFRRPLLTLNPQPKATHDVSLPPTPDLRSHGLLEHWPKLVEDYSRRKLTFGKDKLPAISGLAKTIAAVTDDTYWAGLWKSHVIPQLFWEVFTQEFGLLGCSNPKHEYWCFDHEHDAAKPPEWKPEVKSLSNYRAPSWSWAALDAQVIFTKLELDSIVAECTGCQLVPAGSDPFGMLESGLLGLRVSIKFSTL